MARPRKPAASTNSKPATLDRARFAGVSALAVAESREADSMEDGMQQLARQFESVLQEDPAVDRETREWLQQQFGQALKDAESAPASADAVLDNGLWMEAVRALQEGGAVGEGEADQLIRQLNQALEPLQRRESRLAMEFSRRIGTEGQEKALAWFQAQTRDQSATTEANASSPPSGAASPVVRSETVNSRSRRLRGPPGGR